MFRFDHVSADDVENLVSSLRAQHLDLSNRWLAILEVLNELQASIPKKANTKNLESVKSEDFLCVIGKLNSFFQKPDDETNYRFLTIRQWFTLQNLLLLGMYFESAHYCRRKASQGIELLLHKMPGTCDKASFLLAIGFAVESGAALDVKKINETYKHLPEATRRSVRPAMRGLLLLESGRRRYLLSSRPTLTYENDHSFQEYIAGKSIAIVGPVDVGLENGSEIDSFDVVVRFNHTSASEYDSRIFGSRTDVSYYTNPAFRRLILASNDFLLGLKFAILQDMSQFDLDKPRYGCNFRNQYRKSNAIFLKSHGNAVQRQILDLFRYETGCVKLFNMNLWLSPHSKLYLARRKRLDPHTFIYHDAITNLSFLRRALSVGVIDADAVLGEVLGMSDDEYIAALSARYSPLTNIVR